MSDASTTGSLLGKTRQILDMLAKGGFVEGMEMFYADDVINEESTGVTVQGKQAIIGNEKKSLTR